MSKRPLTRWSEWWATPRSSVLVHRWLKWFWVLIIPLSFLWRDVVAWVVFMSHYAIVVGHWSGEEAALATEKVDEA